MAFFSPHNRFRWLYDEKLPEKAMTFVRQALCLMLAAGLLTLLLVLGLKSVIVLSPWWLEFLVVVPPSLLLYTGLILATRAIRRKDVELLMGVAPIPKRLARIIERIVRD